MSPLTQQAVLSTICSEATTKAEQIAQQPLRATLITEFLSGPHFRLTVQNTAPGLPGWNSGPQNARAVCSRWPVAQVLAVSTCPNGTWPRVFTPVPAGNFEPEIPVMGLYGSSVPDASGGDGGQAVLIAPGWVNWAAGRRGWRVKVTYIAGWPHACVTTAGTAGALSLAVDDCTGWAPATGSTTGAAGIVYDALGGGQEAVTCTAATATAGPGTITLASPLSYAHAAAVMVSALPQAVIWATAELAAADAITRGAQATTIQTMGGKQQAATPDWLCKSAEYRLTRYRRTI